MMRWMTPTMALMLAACSGGDDKAAPAPDESAIATPMPEPAPAAGKQARVGWDKDAMARWNEDRGYEPDAAETVPRVPDKGVGTGDRTIPTAVRGRWGLVAADCTSTKGDAKGLLTIDATNLRFYESHGALARIRERDASRIVADYKFSGEGEEWDRLMVLDSQEGGKALIRRDYGEGAAPEPMRYTRCAG